MYKLSDTQWNKLSVQSADTHIYASYSNNSQSVSSKFNQPSKVTNHQAIMQKMTREHSMIEHSDEQITKKEFFFLAPEHSFNRCILIASDDHEHHSVGTGQEEQQPSSRRAGGGPAPMTRRCRRRHCPRCSCSPAGRRRCSHLGPALRAVPSVPSPCARRRGLARR
uniref:Uncharacterized protein n=1 Tax=Oryza brachyantha TaxID=4533 RepID=J3MT17_ORYBR